MRGFCRSGNEVGRIFVRDFRKLLYYIIILLYYIVINYFSVNLFCFLLRMLSRYCYFVIVFEYFGWEMDIKKRFGD